ncbi:28S ribosomal protein S29, mitochondrial [Latimeria chalumnae]|uniref:28S ribosomal protein S29, mitochondrial n=1 Tax=Latimeria chalumnae TaxID=7897 RepID=UPI00313B848D
MALKSLNRIVHLGQKVSPGYLFHSSNRALEASVALQAETETQKPLAVFRTNEPNPTNHGDQHEGQFYTIPPGEMKIIFPHGLPYNFQQQVKTFNEACVMVRKPALELIGYLKSANYSYPAIRYVLYGQKGTGKTMTLCNAVHYCAKQGWLVLHIPDAHLWVKNCKELMQSSYNKSRFDQPMEASVWLKNFKITNEHFLKQVTTQQRYIWSKRESTEEGRPLAEIVEQGLNRVKSASDVVGVIFKELKRQCLPDTYRLLVAVDGVNAFWGQTTLKKEDKSQVRPDELTLVHNIKKLLKNDWTGGAVVTTVTQTGSLFKPKMAYLPQELLGKEGFDALDPFIPIQISNYTEKEFESCYQYYIDRKWLQHQEARTESGKQELLFLSKSNPWQLERLCAFL